MKKAAVFSGQGSQYVGMMSTLLAVDGARAFVQECDDLLGFSISAICLEGPEDVLRQTRYTQPALFVHEALVVHLLGAEHRFDAFAGHSLGEYSALYAAGVLSLKDALALVKLRGELMFRAGEAEPGTMAAILGLEDEAVESLCERISSESVGGGVVVPANYNSPGQLVISGSAELVRSSLEVFKQAGAKRALELSVSGAFHSPLMKSAQSELAEAINATEFSAPTAPIYCNVSATPETSPEVLRQRLIEQLVSPVRWTQSVRRMAADGIGHCTEIGPGSVLQGLVKRIDRGVSTDGIDTAEHFTSYTTKESA